MTIFIPIVGHVDNGKSSLLSRILYPDKEGNPYELDILQEEKDRGITQEFSLHSYGSITFIDTAGHQAFIRSNIQAYTSYPITMAVVICSLRRGEFNAGFKPRSDVHLPSLMEQLILLKCCGVNNVLVVFTKADVSDECRVTQEDILPPLELFLKQIGVKNRGVIETSASTGAGIDELLRKLTTVQGAVVENPRLLSKPTSLIVCKFRIIFVPKGKLFTKGSRFMIHSGGEETEGVLISIKSSSVLVKPYTDYLAKFELTTPLSTISKRLILRIAEATVGFCKDIYVK